MSYDPTSPWKKTGLIKNKVLDIMNNVYLEFDPLDELYTVPQHYDQTCVAMNCTALQNIGGFLQKETLTL